MAKKKSETVAQDSNLSEMDKIEALIEKKFGTGILKKASHLLTLPQEIISISPVIDYLFGGGITKGSWVVVPGKEKLGKTSTLLYALAKCQKAGMNCYFVNAEGRIKRRDLIGIKGLDVETLGFIGSEEDHILTGEEYLEICNDILRNQRNVAMLIDSLSILSGQEKEKQLEFGKQTRGKFNQSLSGFCSGLSNVIPLKQHILMTTAHIISNTGGGMQTTSEKIGSGFGYQADFKIKTTYAPPWTVGSDENSEEIGKLIHWKCVTSGLGAPGKSAIGRLRYGVGIDEVAENIDFAIDFGVISKKGSWFEYQEQKFQGFDNLREALSSEENIELYNKLVAEVKEML